MVERELFLKKKSLKEALQIWGDVLDELGLKREINEEKVSTQESAFRIVSREVRSKFSSPFYTASAVDGIAINAEDTQGATLANPKTLILGKDGVMLNTGDPLPFGYNAIIMVENIDIKDNTFKIFSSINPYKN
ncbi:MAG: molybdopterin biosynthesis protein, partial [Caldisericota bacterium]|nr:molybdopterin biosynthesis protein [Caldisericota bacterium]